MNVTGTNSAQYASSQSAYRTTGSKLDRDAFLSILVSQLQNQDPLSPMEDTDFIAQMAQFSSLEQMQALNSSFAVSRATGLIGQYVYAEMVDTDSSTSVPVFGKVDGVTMTNGEVYLRVGETDVPVDDVLEVYSSESMENDDVSQTLLQSSSLIGAYVTGYAVENGQTVAVEGIVKSLYISDGVVYAVVGEHKIAITNIVGVEKV